MDKKLYIIMPAYKAEKTMARVFERIAPAMREKISGYLVVDDGSPDGTYAEMQRLASLYPGFAPLRHEVNRGYGGAEKTLLLAALERGADYVIMLHADGQYSPESMGEILACLEQGADIVQGSRVLAGGALKGGMPLYKYLANKSLTFFENLVFGMKMAEYHSGYMAYSRAMLTGAPFPALSDSFDFDLEMIVLAKIAGRTIREVAIPTIYADEVSHLNPIKYGMNVLGVMNQYRKGHYRRLLAAHQSQRSLKEAPHISQSQSPSPSPSQS
jgi:glycosyltransferase involved in cell wall biosynthesis